MKIRLLATSTVLFYLLTINLQLPALALGTAFTYQGRLNSGGTPANGSYDLKFTLYDDASVGSNVGASLTNADAGVSNGLFTVTLDFGAGVFDGNARWLEIGVRTNGGSEFTSLAPRQQITPTPYAVTAGAVTGPINGSSIATGSITSAQLASGAVTAANLASNSITAGQLAPGAAAANLNAASQSGVASGGLVMSLTDNNSALVNAGFSRIGLTATPDVWLPLDSGPIPAGRKWHTAVWTGSEMILWGGQKSSGAGLSDGWRYNPAANSWTAVNTNGAPTARYLHTAVWTGTEMIIWGGYGLNGLKTGARYNPSNDSWTPVTTNGAPIARYSHTAVWTGSEMIVFGGNTGLATGGRYNPATDSWTDIPNQARPGGSAVWTGTEIIVWGGGDGFTQYADDGFRYNPLSNTWTLIANSLPNSPLGRMNHSAVWTGSQMIVWGGTTLSGLTDTGGIYNPSSNSWTSLPNSLPNTPSARQSHTAMWTGNEMVVWGGIASGSQLPSSGGRFNLLGNRWITMSTVGVPAARAYHTAVWTGNEMIVSGGNDISTYFGDTFSYLLGRVMYLYQRP